MQRGSRKNRLLDYWFGAALLNLLATFHRHRSVPKGIRRIGVMCSPALGDALLFSAPLADLRAAYPKAHITHICMLHNLAAAEIIAGADERVLIDLVHPIEAIRALRARKFDVLLDFSNWQRVTAVLTLMSEARYTVGFHTPRMNRSRGYDHTVDHRRDRHELENMRALITQSGLAIKAKRPPSVVLPNVPTPFANEPDVIVFHPWASGQNAGLREWPEHRWIDLSHRLTGSSTLFVITGAPEDTARANALVASLLNSGVRAQAFISPDRFRSLTRLLLHARVVISVNTGVMHLAAILGAPVVALNGPTAEHRWGGRGPRVANVQPVDGSGGFLHLGFEFDGQPSDIMPRIIVDQVVAACTSLIHAPAETPLHRSRKYR